MSKFITAVFTALSMTLFASFANAWQPTGPVTVVISAPAGSLHDRAFKTVLPSLEKQTGIEFILDYKPGAASVKGTKYYRSLPADGQYLLVTASLSHSLNDVAKPDLVDYDFVNDFSYVSGFVASALAVVSSEAGDIDTLEDFVALLKSGKKVNVAMTYPNQEALVRYMVRESGANPENVKFIKYKNPSQALTDVVGGVVDVFVGGVGPAVPLYKAEKVRYVAVTSTNRLKFIPDVQTVGEVFPGVAMPTILGVVVNAGTSPEAVQFFQEALIKAAKTTEAEQIRDKSFFYLEEDALTGEGQLKMYQGTRATWKPVYEEMFTK